MSARKALILGAISGLRSASGPAFVARAANRGDMNFGGTRLAFLDSPLLSKTLTMMQLGEIVGDKLPIAPSRTALLPLLGRAASGGLVGAAAYVSEDRRLAIGVTIGASAAVVSAYAWERLRGQLSERTGFPDALVALLEDGVVLFGGSRILR